MPPEKPQFTHDSPKEITNSWFDLTKKASREPANRFLHKHITEMKDLAVKLFDLTQTAESKKEAPPTDLSAAQLKGIVDYYRLAGDYLKAVLELESASNNANIYEDITTTTNDYAEYVRNLDTAKNNLEKTNEAFSKKFKEIEPLFIDPNIIGHLKGLQEKIDQKAKSVQESGDIRRVTLEREKLSGTVLDSEY